MHTCFFMKSNPLLRSNAKPNARVKGLFTRPKKRTARNETSSKYRNAPVLILEHDAYGFYE